MPRGSFLFWKMKAVASLLAPVVAPAALAVPCGTPPKFGPVISAQLSPLVPGSVRLHFETAVGGYAPQFGAAAVSAATPGNITIVVPVTDDADAGGLNAPVPSTFCDSEDVEQGPLAAGIYNIGILHRILIGGVDHGLRGAGGVGLAWTAGGTMQCSTTRTFSLSPLSPAIDTPIRVTSTRLMTGSFVDATVQVGANTIDVTENVSSEVPPPGGSVHALLPDHGGEPRTAACE